MKKRAIDSNMSLNPKVCITRDKRLEAYLMAKPGKLINRRQTAAQPRSNMKSSRIPIGARGRRRSTAIMFVGLTPNLDGQTSQPSQTVRVPNLPTNTVARNNFGQIPRPPTPPRRTSNYGRAQTPGPSNPRFQSTPISLAPSPPSNHLLMPPYEDDSTVSIDFDGSFLGFLHYSASDTSDTE